MSEIKWENSV